ncbi:Beta-glucosidase 13 [Striga hermonthica]|uniref:Beta-glucosidase 13 n=1 Tax=Striga hermonthica TaxID=68872 RepID=A0A9N7N2G6_STRHE|nr:Beta-glucosidase 13 [Striga hermonthica]
MATSVSMTAPEVVPYDFGRHLTRHDFPKGFLFGGATSAYQVEGAYNVGGRGMANWDAWSLMKPGKVSDGGNGCRAIDHYHNLKEDVKLMKDMGIETYRFSISWTRILPGGQLSTGVNKEGVKFYNDMIDLLIEAGIEPVATIFHFDTPRSLQDEYKGFLDRRIVHDFGNYAEVCFREFGDRVKFWVTVNEPSTYTVLGYVDGVFPPGHGSPPGELGLRFVNYRNVRGIDRTLYGGNAATEPYIVAHHLILCHAKAVDIYRKKFQAVQGGKIGIVVVPNSWYVPYSDKKEDKDAAVRAVEFLLGWFVQPLVSGEYPDSMQTRVKERLPKFTEKERKKVTGSYDYIGLNYYTTIYAAYKKKQPHDPTNYYTDQEVEFHSKRSNEKNFHFSLAGSEWLYIVPRGIYELLTYAKRQYNDPVIYITENGKKDKVLPISLLLKDDYRIKYHQQHLAYVKRAIDKDKVNVKGYAVWSIFDNYEWAAGYTVRFGMYFVDYLNGLTRYPKKSVFWYMNFLNKKKLPGPRDREIMEIEGVEEEEKAGKRKRNV